MRYKQTNVWGFNVNTQAQRMGATAVNIQIQLPSHFTQKRAWSWVLFALVSGTIGYQLALQRQAPIGDAASGMIKKSIFIAEANATVTGFSQATPSFSQANYGFSQATSRFSQATSAPVAALQRTYPDFSLRLDKTLNANAVAHLAFDSAFNSTFVMARQLSHPVKAQAMHVAQLTMPPLGTQAATSHAILPASRSLALHEPVMTEFVSSESVFPESVFKAQPLPLLEAKIRISKHMNAHQQAAHDYQQAIALLQQGRVAEAQDLLKKALDKDATHEDARQTLVGLLVDNRQMDEAIATLKTGLTVSPKQPSFTQALARLQLDAGLAQDALNTLQAGGNTHLDAEHQALFAVVQQQLQHHDDAIAHFQLALNQSANTPTWLIGLGVSLQMVGRNQEAKNSFLQAQQADLNQELALFVAERIKQVSH